MRKQTIMLLAVVGAAALTACSNGDTGATGGNGPIVSTQDSPQFAEQCPNLSGDYESQQSDGGLKSLSVSFEPQTEHKALAFDQDGMPTAPAADAPVTEVTPARYNVTSDSYAMIDHEQCKGCKVTKMRRYAPTQKEEIVVGSGRVENIKVAEDGTKSGSYYKSQCSPISLNIQRFDANNNLLSAASFTAGEGGQLKVVQVQYENGKAVSSDENVYQKTKSWTESASETISGAYDSVKNRIQQLVK